MSRVLCLGALLSLALATAAGAQDRDTKVRGDRQDFAERSDWVYNDLAAGIAQARRTGKPLLVVFRCIPCEACAGFDEQVARGDPLIDSLIDRFICVRIVQGNGADLSLFQFDYDMSFAAFFLNADKTIYGRFGTMSNHDDPQSEISLEGFRQALTAALDLHAAWPGNRPLLAGKQGPPPRFKTPEQYPSLKRYTSELDYQGKVAQSCIHCHQIRDAERDYLRQARRPMPDHVLYPWPMPAAVGLVFDKDSTARVAEVLPDSPAAQAGFRPGDLLVTLGGQALLSIADVQWVLHSATAPTDLPAEVQRGDQRHTLTLHLDADWRRGGDISWRATTWGLRRMGTGGLVLVDLTDEQRNQAGIALDALALRVKHVGQFGDHAAARRAGFQRDDILVAVDGQRNRMSESDFLALVLRKWAPGDRVAVTVLRGGRPLAMHLPMQ